MKYIVMECHFSYVILLDEDGKFLKAANRGYQVGQAVYDPVLVGSYRYRPPVTRMIARGVTLIAACLLIFFGFSYYRNNIEPYSTILLTINPEVKMELNRRGEVLELVGINADGMTLIAGYDYEDKDKITVADELIDRAIEMGFLADGGNVAFTVNVPDQELRRTYESELQDQVAAYLAGRINVEITVIGDDLPAVTDPTSLTTPPNTPSTTDPTPTYIGTDRALEIALDHAGVTPDKVEKNELDEDDGVMVYELDFIAGGIEYEYEIDALTGAILQHQSEPVD
ncbi:MAG: PepSY domain-containing protein [Clostridia bacterium]|nr:PepSY domain-containing protein [Clostridia bacterium]